MTLLQTPHLHPLPCEQSPHAPFQNAGDAWFWAVEVLRRRLLPRSSMQTFESIALTPAQLAAQRLKPLNLPHEASQVAAEWGKRFNPALPHDAAGRLALALQIQQAVQNLSAPQAKLLQLWAWGDWADAARLRAACTHQERLRQTGVRVRLSYRYSTAQLALLEGTSKATIWRLLNKALKELEAALAALQLVTPPAPVAETKPSRQRVEARAFKQG